MHASAFAAATRGRRRPLHSSSSLLSAPVHDAASALTTVAAAAVGAPASVYAASTFPDYAQLTREAEEYEAARAARDARLLEDASTLIVSFPGSATRELDAWCARLQMLTCVLSTASEFSGSHAALRQQLVDATAFASKWQEARACSGSLLESVSSLDADGRARLQTVVNSLVAAWRARAAAAAWVYRQQHVYALGGPAAVLVCPLHTALEELAVAVRRHDADMGATDAFPPELLPAALRLAADVIHDEADAEGTVLCIRMSVIVFVNATVTITAAGLELHGRVDPPKASAGIPAVSARAYVPISLPHGGVDAISFDAGAFASELMPVAADVFPVLGALLRPAVLRSADLRPVFILATSPQDVTHAFVWALHTFGGHAVTRVMTGTAADTRVPTDTEAYILFIDAKLREVTREDVAAIARALACQMAVVIAADTVPPILYTDECEYLRLALMHVRVDAPLSAVKHQVVCEQLLFACTTAYQQQRHSTALSFITTTPALRYRLDYSAHRRLVPTLLMEMLQSGFGLRLVAGKSCYKRTVDAMLELYHVRRCPGDMVRPQCHVDDVLAAAAAFRQYFGSHFCFESLSFDPKTTCFLNLDVGAMPE
jgi:hypothetical protein